LPDFQSPANWLPQATNTADALGNLIFTNAPDPATNDFWRIRSVPYFFISAPPKTSFPKFRRSATLWP